MKDGILEFIKACKGLPWKPRPDSESTNILPAAIPLTVVPRSELPDFPTAEVESKKRGPQRIAITKAVLGKVGYTAGCPGCESAMRRGPAKNHSEACRQRIEKEIEKYPEFAVRMEAADKRQKVRFEQEVEAVEVEQERARVEGTSGSSRSVEVSQRIGEDSGGSR